MKKALSLLLLPLMLLLAAPVQAKEYKDFIFKGMSGYEITDQTRAFGQLTIKSPKPGTGGKDFVETKYEGNRVYSRYDFSGKTDSAPSGLQVLRNYQNVVKKLGGEILFEGDDKFDASFKRNDKQYYIQVVNSSSSINHPSGRYRVYIIEVAEMDDEIEIVDSDTILHKLEKEGHIALYINFDTGKATIKPESKDIVDEVVTALKAKPKLKVKLEGHTDNVGSAADNKKLSDARAKAVMDAIVVKGIDKSRLSAEGFGLEKPIADNGTEAGRAKNRRVELVKVE
ncbi:MAG: OmpA family protein [Proteobacteria bacterium]|nr:OmpA family protein [Pseudomonadota bacterium]MCL2307984.1 OmpA family protein [Pseudomonadota bacterium]